jgi:hypothetical protein
MIVLDSVFLPVELDSRISFGFSAQQFILIFILTAFFYNFFREHSKCCDAEEKRELKIKRKWPYRFWSFGLVCTAASFAVPFIGLLSYLVYFIYKCYSHRRKMKSTE